MRPLTSGQRTDRLGYNVPSSGRRRGGQHADDTTGISFSARRDGDYLASSVCLCFDARDILDTLTDTANAVD